MGRNKTTKQGQATAVLIKKLLDRSGMTQAGFADKLGVTQPMISSWVSGRGRVPLSKWLELGNSAPYPENIECWKRAGLDEQSMVSAAAKLQKDRSAPPIAGEIVRVSRVRETLEGREAAGAPIALPLDFIPNPAATVCLVVDDKATAVVDCDEGAFIVDESERHATNLRPFWGRVIFARFDADAGAGHYDSGIYAGRLSLVATSEKTLRLAARLWPITSTHPQMVHWVGRLTDPKAPALEYPLLHGNSEFDPREKPSVRAVWKESVDRMKGVIGLDPGWTVLGHAIGRLHIKGAKNDPWSLRL